MQQHSVAKKSRPVKYTLQLSSKTKHQQPKFLQYPRCVCVSCWCCCRDPSSKDFKQKSCFLCESTAARTQDSPNGRPFFPSFIPQAVLVYSKTVWNPHKYCQRGKETQEKITRAVENSRLLRQTALLRIYF